MKNQIETRGRPRNKPDTLSPFLQEMITNISEIETLKLNFSFDKENPPFDDEGFIQLIKENSEKTYKILENVYGLDRKDYCFSNIEWQYRKNISNFYLTIEIFIFDESTRIEILKNNLKIN